MHNLGYERVFIKKLPLNYYAWWSKNQVAKFLEILIPLPLNGHFYYMYKVYRLKWSFGKPCPRGLWMTPYLKWMMVSILNNTLLPTLFWLILASSIELFNRLHTNICISQDNFTTNESVNYLPYGGRFQPFVGTTI